MTNQIYVFVYGTLRKNQPNHKFLFSAEYIGTFISLQQFQMVSYRDFNFPYLLEDYITNKSLTNITGEIYKVNQKTLQQLDILEFHPKIYERKFHKFINDKNQIMEAWVYILNNEQIINLIKNEIGINYHLIESGNWCNFFKYYQNEYC
jgi:gamma-glutamylaminecyclotransferase